MIDNFHGSFRLVLAIPFLQAAAGGRERIMRIKRQQNEFVIRLALERGDGLGSAGMPIAHGDNGARGKVRSQSHFQGTRLLLGKTANGRATANCGVVLADHF